MNQSYINLKWRSGPKLTCFCPLQCCSETTGLLHGRDGNMVRQISFNEDPVLHTTKPDDMGTSFKPREERRELL
jgi:hypothetical protein